MAEHNELGIAGETLARKHLSKNGYKILEQNWRFQKAEIDIIAAYEDLVVMVEVKTRTSKSFERPQDAVTLSKQKFIIKAADAYLSQKNIEKECRFDVISILVQGNKSNLEHIEDAFSPLW